MASSDDDDAYLYSSEDERPAAKKARIEPDKAPEAAAEIAGQKTASDSADAASKNANISDAVGDSVGGNTPSNMDENDDDDEEEEEESSDDDIEFVIGDPAPRPVTTNATVSSTSGPLNDAIGEVNDEDDDTDGKGDVESGAIKKSVVKDDGGATIDINAVAEYEGKPLTRLDLDELKEKPWRAPGADISDYFNYGFDEFTWTAYCHKQDQLRGEFKPQEVMAKMMGGSTGGMPFPFPFMPNMPNMPNMPMPPNMGNMGNMPMPPNMGNMPNMAMPPSNPGNMGNKPSQPAGAGFGGNGNSSDKPASRQQGFGRYRS